MGDDRSLVGQVGVVTGGASGIGRGIAEAMVARGMKVVIADIDKDNVTRVAADIGAAGQQVDVANEDSVAELAAWVMQEYGAVHVLCNNAGVALAGLIEDMSVAEWRWILDVNLWGVIHGINSFLPLLRKNERSYMVNTSSLSGLMGLPTRGAYAASKFGIVAVSEILAQEMALLETGVNVGILCAGPTQSNLGQGSPHRPEGVGSGIPQEKDFILGKGGFLAGQEVAHLTGRQVGEITLDSMLREELYIQTHPNLGENIAQRHRAIEDSFQQ